MKFFRIFLFTLASIVDVRVHAGTLSILSQTYVTQEPAGCIDSEKVCGIKTIPGRKYEVTIGTAIVTLGSATSLIRTGVSSAILLSGEAWVKADGEFELQSEYGYYKLSGGEAWFIRTDSRLTVRSVVGAGELIPKGDSPLSVPAGFEMWISGVTKKGHASASVPQVIDFKDHVKRWARLYSKPKKNFKAELKVLRETWMSAVEMSSKFDADLVQREVASEYQSKIHREKTERENKEEASRLKSLFHQKQFE